jgi:hypothetical protein
MRWVLAAVLSTPGALSTQMAIECAGSVSSTDAAKMHVWDYVGNEPQWPRIAEGAAASASSRATVAGVPPARPRPLPTGSGCSGVVVRQSRRH